MSLRDIALEDSLKRINQFEAILQLSILKNEASSTDQGEIGELLSKAKSVLYNNNTGDLNLNTSDQLKNIKKRLENKQRQDAVSKFDFEVKTLSMESILDDLNKHDLIAREYIESFGTSNLIYLNKAWINGTAEFKKENMAVKYVKIVDTSTQRQGFAMANSFSFGIQSEIKKCISYLDSETKIVNWEQSCIELKSLSKSSGYTENDVRLALMGFLRLGNLNQDLYTDMTINEIAQSLINSVRPIHKQTILWGSLRALERVVKTPLQLILAEAESYIRKLFPDERQKKIRENYFFIALTSFTNDKISLEVSTEIKRKKELGEYYSYDSYKDMCLKLEMTESNIPTDILKYGRNIKKQNSMHEETLLNTSLNNLKSKPHVTDNESSDEEIDFLNFNIHNKKRNTIFTAQKKIDLSTSDKPSLGTCFGDRSEDDITVYLKFASEYYSVPLKICDVRMQLALLGAMKQGRIHGTVDLLWKDNEKYMEKITKDEFKTAKELGCKPNERWAERKEHTLNVTLTTEINKIRTSSNRTDKIQTADVHRSESDTYESPTASSEEDSDITALNNTNIRSNPTNNGYQRDYGQYKPLYNNDNNTNNQYNGNYRSYDNKYVNGANSNVSNTPYYRNKSNSPYRSQDSYNYKYNQNSDNRKQYYTDRQRYDNNTDKQKYDNNTDKQRYDDKTEKQRYDTNTGKQRYDNNTNGYNKQSDKQYSNTYPDYNRFSSSQTRSPSRTDADRFQRARSQSANNEYDRNRIQRNSSYDRNRIQRNSSYDRNRQKYPYSYSREERNRTPSKDTYDRYNSNKYNGSNQNKERQDRSGYNRYDRSISRDRYRSQERGRTLERRRQSDPSNNQSRSLNKRDSDNNRSRNTSRDKSLELRLRYPKFKPGDNCDSNYNPSRMKLCRKCSLKGHFTHHEFECKKFTKFNDYPCKKCQNGFHFEKECSNNTSSTLNIEDEGAGKN